MSSQHGLESDDVEQLRNVVRCAFAGRRVVVAGAPVAGSTSRIANLRALGVPRCLVLGNGRGTGPLPDPADADVAQWDLPPAVDLPASLRMEEQLFAEPPQCFVDALLDFDPDGDAIVLAPPFAAVYEIDGRTVYGGRRREWVALEDKAVVDELLAAASVPSPAYEIVAGEPNALADAAARLDAGDGTVWAGDATFGFTGGAAHVRWVRDAADAADATALLAGCAQVRVARFVEGIPCSVHGFVTDDGVAAFRPVELLTLRSETRPRLHFAGGSTVWDPPAADRAAMRDAARRVGAVLRDRVAFRGAFTVDGILSADGWVATEVNPRYGAGLQYTRAAVPQLALDLLHHVVIAGAGAEVTAAALEAVFVPAADTRRWAATWIGSRSSWTESTTIDLAGDEHGYTTASADVRPDAHLTLGPGPIGGFVRCEFEPSRIPIGTAIAPRAVTALAFASAHFDAGIPPMTAPVSVR